MTPLTETADVAIPELKNLQQRLLVTGAVGAAVSVIGLFLNATQFLQSYLMAYMLWLGVTLGCLALGMIHQLSGGAWGVLIRRPIGAATRVLPLMTVLFLPIALGLPRMYPWTNADLVAHDEALQHKHLYLNTPFFLVRAAIYFLAWNTIAYFLNAMSLEPHWFSTIYGVLIIGGQGLTALAFLIIALVWLSRRPPLERIVVPAHFHDLGNLTLAFVMLWAYFSFSQYLIIWSGNLPTEIAWYLHRMQTGWRPVAIALMLFHFAAPFVVLLSRTVKRQPELLVKVAIGILIVRLVDLWWLIGPEFHTSGIAISWMDAVLPLTIG